jgi:hypothetical protein
VSGGKNNGRRSQEIYPLVRSDWSVGPRTVAWDRLWRAILGDLGAIPVTDARDQLESEVGDA